MSLDVYLELPGAIAPVSKGIFIREGGQTKEISRAEWDERFPDREPVMVVQGDESTDEVYSSNITHNLGKMAAEAGIYKALWRPEEIGIGAAAQLIEPLTAGLDLLKAEPDKFKAFNPENGWGAYEGLISFVEGYIEACKAHPNAHVRVWR